MKKIEKWIKSWEWPDDVTNEVEKLLKDGQTLNICAGASRLGDVKIDLDLRKQTCRKATCATCNLMMRRSIIQS